MSNLGTTITYVVTQKCTGKSCSALHYPGFAVIKRDGKISRIYNKESLLLERIFVNTKDTLFTIDFMIHTCALIHRCIISFKVIINE